MAVLHEYLDRVDSHYIKANVHGAFVTYQVTYQGERVLAALHLRDGDEIPRKVFQLLLDNNYAYTNSGGTEEQEYTVLDTGTGKGGTVLNISRYNVEEEIRRIRESHAGRHKGKTAPPPSTRQKPQQERKSKQKPKRPKCPVCGCRIPEGKAAEHEAKCGIRYVPRPDTFMKKREPVPAPRRHLVMKVHVRHCPACGAAVPAARFEEHVNACSGNPGRGMKETKGEKR